MSSLVMEIEDYELSAGQATAVSRKATYFLLMIGSDVNVEFSFKGSRIGGGKGLQGGDAVGPLSQPYDQVTLTSATAQTVKVATSSDPVTITRLSGVVQIDGVVQTAADYDRSQRGEALQAYAELGAESGLFGIIQFENPLDSGKNWVIQNISSGNNVSTQAPIVAALLPDNAGNAFANNKLVSEPRPYINIYAENLATTVNPKKTVQPISTGDNPIILPPGYVLTVQNGQTNEFTLAEINYFEVNA